jgi:hypothetical protein
MRAIAVSVLLLAACEAPQAKLRFRLATGESSQACPSLECRDIPVSCASFLSIRVIDPAKPQTPFSSQCEPIPLFGVVDDLCSIASIPMEERELPLRDLEVQVAVFPASMVTRNEDGTYQCPTYVQYDAGNGFPVPPNVPALGGRAFYRPGDETTVVTLGCSNLELVHNDSCIGTANVHVTATVDDFDTRVSVSAAEGDRLLLHVGAPQANGAEWALDTGLTQLTRGMDSWSGNVDQLFTTYACLSVLDRAPESTSTVTCKTASVTDDELDFTVTPGVRLKKSSLDQILAALSLSRFPIGGLTIGIVLDQDGFPRGGHVIEPIVESGVPTPTIKYLSGDRMSASGTATSTGNGGGVFVSLDAPFGTRFRTSASILGLPPKQVEALGGRIAGTITIVVLQFQEPIVNP